MKKNTLLFVILITLVTNLAAQDSGVGIGVLLGSPFGISAKYWTASSNAVDASLGYSFIENKSRFSFHADYLYRGLKLFKPQLKINFYYGFGIRLRFKSNENSSTGIRGVVGANLYLREKPIEFFIETAPSFRLLPSTGLDFDAGFGIRYYFKTNF